MYSAFFQAEAKQMRRMRRKENGVHDTPASSKRWNKSGYITVVRVRSGGVRRATGSGSEGGILNGCNQY